MKTKQLFLIGISLLMNQLQLFAQGNAIDFKGTDGTNGEFVEVINGSALVANSNTISYDFWVYPRTATISNWQTDFEGIMGFREANNSFCIVRTTDAAVEAMITTNTGTVQIHGSIAVGVWQHFALVFDGSTFKLYRNGILQDNKAATGQITNSTLPLHLGKQFYSSYHWPLNGQMDEIRVWKKALSESEIKEVMTKSLNGNETGLVAYYKCNEASGTTLGNAVATAPGGTLKNMTGTTEWKESYAMVVPQIKLPSKIKNTSFQANWAEPLTGTYDHYLLDVAKDSTFITLVSGYAALIVTGNTQVQIDNLTQKTTYYYRVRASKTSLGEIGAYSNYLKLTTSTSDTIKVLDISNNNFVFPEKMIVDTLKIKPGVTLTMGTDSLIVKGPFECSGTLNAGNATMICMNSLNISGTLNGGNANIHIGGDIGGTGTFEPQQSTLIFDLPNIDGDINVKLQDLNNAIIDFSNSNQTNDFDLSRKINIIGDSINLTGNLTINNGNCVFNSSTKINIDGDIRLKSNSSCIINSNNFSTDNPMSVSLGSKLKINSNTNTFLSTLTIADNSMAILPTLSTSSNTFLGSVNLINNSSLILPGIPSSECVFDNNLSSSSNSTISFGNGNIAFNKNMYLSGNVNPGNSTIDILGTDPVLMCNNYNNLNLKGTGITTLTGNNNGLLGVKNQNAETIKQNDMESTIENKTEGGIYRSKADFAVINLDGSLTIVSGNVNLVDCTLQTKGNININDGTLNVGSNNINCSGDFISHVGGFIPGTSTVFFSGENQCIANSRFNAVEVMPTILGLENNMRFQVGFFPTNEFAINTNSRSKEVQDSTIIIEQLFTKDPSVNIIITGNKAVIGDLKNAGKVDLSAGVNLELNKYSNYYPTPISSRKLSKTGINAAPSILLGKGDKHGSITMNVVGNKNDTIILPLATDTANITPISVFMSDINLQGDTGKVTFDLNTVPVVKKNLPSNYLNRNWTMTTHNINSYKAKVACVYLDTDITGSEVNLSPYQISTDSIWTNGDSIDFATNTMYFNVNKSASFTASFKDYFTELPGKEILFEKLRIYPNPITNKVFVETNEPVKIQIINRIGMKVYQSDEKQCKHNIDLSGYSTGIYLMSIIGDNKQQTEKIIIK
ncbi:MAG: LamG-like jellyroll fold domain-containing protein [Paludibacter sp.]